VGWTVEQVEAGDGYVPVGGDPPTNDVELALGVLAVTAGLAWGAWTALVDTWVVAAGGAAAAIGGIGVVVLVRLGRAGLYVGRRGLLVRRVLGWDEEIGWGDVRSIAVVDRLPQPWRVLRIDTADGRRLWSSQVRTQVGAARVRRAEPLEPGGPGFADDVAARLEELWRRAGGAPA
jgi:hypothetical protein